MAITSSQSNAQSVTSVAHGYYLDSAASPVALNAAVGFKPRYVRFREPDRPHQIRVV
jgi:hypothetical protein